MKTGRKWSVSVDDTPDSAAVLEAEHLHSAVTKPGTDVRPGAEPTERPQRKRSVTRLVGSWVLFAIVCTVGWLALGPTQVRGPASYVVVSGDSMKPTYQDGDLVIARKKSSYQVGDIILFDPRVGEVFSVIHRIIEIRPDGFYVTQGDNRPDADGWFLSNDDVFGSAVVRLPYTGSVIRLIREPSLWFAVASIILVLVSIDLLRHSRRPAAVAMPNDGEAGS